MSESMSDCSKRMNNFCYMCGRFTIMPTRRNITSKLAELYEQYFNIAVIKNVDWVPTIACTSCANRLRDWDKGRIESMPFGIPMIWSDPGPHDSENCYVCANYVWGTNRMRKIKVYKEVRSAQCPIPHSESIPIPKRPSPTEEYVPPTFESMPESTVSLYQPSNVTPPCEHIEISQQRLDLMSRQLKLSQARQIILSKHLKAVNILAPDVKVYGSRGRQRNFKPYFDRDATNTFAYCTDICGLMRAMNYRYDPEEWRLFIDSSKRSLKAVLLYIDNTKNPVPIAISSNTKENYESMKKIIDSVKYCEHLWRICADLKVVALLCGLQTGYTKNMCFLCLWDSRSVSNQYQNRDWQPRQTPILRQHNLINQPLVPMEKVLLPPLHIKLGIVKSFIKTIVKKGNSKAFERLQQTFPRLSEMKIKEGQ